MPQDLVEICIDEAEDKYPLETGGAFMGYWADRETAVIRTMIGPGPNADHRRRSFQPDETWQQREIANHYAVSGRRETYLGDWHTHPNASSGALSWVDRRALRRVIRTPSARCPIPLMLLFCGEPDNWSLTGWQARLHHRRLLWSALVLDKVDMSYFASD